MAVLVGTSGWQYRDWRGVLYPPGLPQRLWLEGYARRFPTVESNNAFYRLPAPETFAAWRERTPPGFVMALKASRFLTHIRRLREPEEPVRRLLAHAGPLAERHGPVLLQLPPTLPELLPSAPPFRVEVQGILASAARRGAAPLLRSPCPTTELSDLPPDGREVKPVETW
nr:DUF72 domain-containing protein [Streptomyces sp. JJ66]